MAKKATALEDKLLRNYVIERYYSTGEMPSLHQIRQGYSCGTSRATRARKEAERYIARKDRFEILQAMSVFAGFENLDEFVEVLAGLPGLPVSELQMRELKTINRLSLDIAVEPNYNRRLTKLWERLEV